MEQTRSVSASKWAVRVASGLAVLNGCFWLVAWLSGAVFQWSSAGVLTAKTNMAVGQILAGLALFVLGSERVNRKVIALGVIAAGCVLLIGGCTLSEHLLGIDFGIDQLLAKESPGAVGTTQPNRMGLPGSTSLALIGAGLLLLVRHRRLALYPGLLVCLITLVPLVGFLYRVQEFYKLSHLTGIAWSTAVVLMGLGVALVVVDGRTGPMAVLRRNDAGGRLLRQWLPIVLLVPIVLGYLPVQGERHGWFDLEVGTGSLVLLMVVIFILLLWRTAEQLSRVAQSQAAAEAVLVQNEQRYRLLFERNPDGVFVVETSGRFTVANPACATISGYSNEELLKKNFMELCAPDQLLKTTEQFKRTLSEQAYTQIETALVRKDGGRVELWIAGEPLLNHGKIVAVHCTARDMTERTRAERALRESEQQFRTLADSIPHLAWWATGVSPGSIDAGTNTPALRRRRWKTGVGKTFTIRRSCLRCSIVGKAR